MMSIGGSVFRKYKPPKPKMPTLTPEQQEAITGRILAEREADLRKEELERNVRTDVTNQPVKANFRKKPTFIENTSESNVLEE